MFRRFLLSFDVCACASVFYHKVHIQDYRCSVLQRPVRHSGTFYVRYEACQYAWHLALHDHPYSSSMSVCVCWLLCQIYQGCCVRVLNSGRQRNGAQLEWLKCVPSHIVLPCFYPCFFERFANTHLEAC